MPERELTKAERDSIRELVTKLCANYHWEYGCLPLDGACYMLLKCWTGAYCRYFQSAVLPLNPALEAELLDTKEYIKHKICPSCGSRYYPVTSQAYCSEACRVKGYREMERKKKQKQRKNKR